MNNELVQHFTERFINGWRYATISAARQEAKPFMDAALPTGEQHKLIDEALEAALTRTARRIVRVGASLPPTAVYDKLVTLYQRQPTLSTRSSTSMLRQQYSTPLPIAYLVSVLADVTQTTTVWEPTAGNGALLIATNPLGVWANEIDPNRVAELRQQGYPRVSNLDAVNSTVLPRELCDRVICNPPFGKHRQAGSRKNTTFVFQLQRDSEAFKTSFVTTEIDHAIAWNALNGMKPDGKAVLIIGSELLIDAEERSNRYNSLENRRFFKALYDSYNVVDHFTIDGSLYRKQGAGFPIDVIVIHGAGQSSRTLPAADLPRVYASFDELRSLIPSDPPPDPGFHMMFSGVQGTEELSMLREAGVAQILVDPYQYERIKDDLGDDFRVVLDSGAYARSKGRGGALTIEQHLKIVNSRPFWFVVPLDVVPNETMPLSEAIAQTQANWAEVRDLIYPWMPVWQWGGSIRDLEDLLAEAPIVAVGGLVRLLRNDLQWRIVTDGLVELCQKYPRRLHLFGLCRMEAIERLKPYAYSADTSAWIAKRSGEVIYIDADGHLLRKPARDLRLGSDKRERCVESAKNLWQFCSGQTKPGTKKVDAALISAKEAIRKLLSDVNVLMSLTTEDAKTYLQALNS